MRLLTSGFAISPSRPQTPRGDGGGGGGGGLALPLSLPPNRDKVVNVSPRGQGQAQRGVVGYAAVQVWLLQVHRAHIRISDSIRGCLSVGQLVRLFIKSCETRLRLGSPFPDCYPWGIRWKSA